MRDVGEQAIAVAALKHAIPYLRLYQGSTFVLKTGGAVFGDREAARHLLEQVGILHQVGIRVVLVHGGGPQSTELATALGIETRFVEGRRVTDERTLDVTTMVLNGSVNTRVLATFRDLGVPAVGLSGVDAGLIRARKRAPVVGGDETVDYGYVGDIVSVNGTVLRKLLEERLVPVVSPISADENGTILNINADTVASAIAAELGAAKLILMTGAPGILENADDPRSLVSYVDVSGLERMRETGSVSKGMLPKIEAMTAAIRAGVERVHVISHDLPDSLLLEVFSNEGSGTLVVENVDSLRPEEQTVGEKSAGGAT